MVIISLISMSAVFCWFLVFSKATRKRMPRLWWTKALCKNREEPRDLTDGMILISALLMAMVFTFLSFAAVVRLLAESSSVQK